ncbi:MAG TPA: glycoside hydrolase family 38 C-terminal domain-containing protein [Armatimonadota bacterium]
MSMTDQLDQALQAFEGASAGAREQFERIRAEIDFAAKLAEAQGNAAWQGLVLQALAAVQQALANGQSPAAAVAAGEAVLAPLGKAAKAYTIHCVGHAHIDMNWMWNWPETVATVNDTFTTVDRLMDEFPDFRFSQSQASVYYILNEYLPELAARVKQRVREGRWEITASQWVEGDKNLASGEIICRHLLYTRRFFKEEYGLPYDAVTIDWEPDTFGHPHSLPGLLTHGGVKRYYFHRGREKTPWLFWWQGQDGSRLLAFDDWVRAYNGQINPAIANPLFDFEQGTGLKDLLFVYGVGDHGGGPTRRDLVAIEKMMAWPIFPRVKFSTTDEFFAIAERQAKELPVLDAEMNFIVEGCYTSQSNVKNANRKSENALVEAECYALLGRSLAGQPYPTEALATGWRHAMFNQFHDILPGSGVHATYEHAQGLFQEIMAQTSMVKTRALRAIAGRVDTLAACGCAPAEGGHGAGIGPGIGGGPGDYPGDGMITRRGAGGACCDPLVVFNPSPWARSEVVTMRLWDRDYPTERIVVRDESGAILPAQVLANGNWYWGHKYTDVALPAKESPGLGDRSYSVQRAAAPAAAPAGCNGDGRGTIENEFFSVTMEQESGAIVHLIDKRTGIDFVPAGARLGLLEYGVEAPHGMTAWVLGQIVEWHPFTEGGTLECPQNGPYLATVRSKHALHDSTFTLTISLAAGVPRVDFQLETNWLERGSDTIGVPTLKVAFPLAVEDGRATFECPNGHVERPADPKKLPSFTYETLVRYSNATPPVPRYAVDSPALKWVDLTGSHVGALGKPVGAAVLNDSKYGFSVDGQTIRIDLLRSSYDPDPLPELGAHTIRFALCPHVGPWSPADATRAGSAFNAPFNVVGADQHAGDLPPTAGFLDILTPNVMLSGLKKAEDADALILRLYETDGKATRAQVKLDAALAPSNAPAVETDVLEQPLPTNTAKMQDDIVTVDLPAYGMVTVKIG